VSAQGISFDKYHTNDEVQQILNSLQTGNSGSVKLHTIATSPGGEEVKVLEIGSSLEDVPAIFVGANFEGDRPISTEGALYLAQMLLDSSKYTENIKWYILPQPNPDAAAGYFADVKYNLSVNQFEINKDVDEALNEDGFEDLNGDGLITKMRVKDIEGSYVVSKNDARIMVRAKTSKGERGAYKIYTEGIDNDADGKYNEDGPGGINVGIAFPHLFPRDKKEAGRFSGETPEVYGILRFIYDRPEIAMVYTLGSSDFCAVQPKGGRKGGANLSNIKLPGRYARMFGADPNKTYTMEQVIEMVKPQVPPGMEVTPSMVAGFLGLGAAVNPLDADLKFYKNFNQEYKKFLEAKNYKTEALDPAPAKDGSFELWAYYHLGVPSFSMNLFTVPKVKEEKKEENGALSLDEVEKMETEEFVALGEEKIDAFLKENNATKFNAKTVIDMMESGKVTPKQMVAMLKNMPKPEKEEGELSDKDKALLAWSESHWEGKGFVTWEAAEHPTLGDVEIGGYAPYLESTPKAELIDSLASIKIPWLLQLSTKMPELKIADSKTTELGKGVYKLEVFVENKGEIAYPISMGERNNYPAPVMLVLDGDIEILEGTKRMKVGSIGSNQVKKLSWIVKAKINSTIDARLESVVFTDDVKQIKIGG